MPLTNPTRGVYGCDDCQETWEVWIVDEPHGDGFDVVEGATTCPSCGSADTSLLERD